MKIGNTEIQRRYIVLSFVIVGIVILTSVYGLDLESAMKVIQNLIQYMEGISI